MTQKQLNARASLVKEWILDGRIDRCEGFRLIMDSYLGEDSGTIQWSDDINKTRIENLEEMDIL